ncbi:cell envelope integrity protein TolA [Aeromonas veronii]
MAFTVRLSTLLALLFGLVAGSIGGYYFSKWEPFIKEYIDTVNHRNSFEPNTAPSATMSEQEIMQRELTKQFQQYTGRPLSEIDKYATMIKSELESKLKLTDQMKGQECKLNIHMAPDGKITQVKIISGNTELCNAGIDAAKKVYKFPAPKTKDTYEMIKEFNIQLNPDL